MKTMKLLRIILVGLPLLVMATLAAIVLAAHWQIRQVEPPLPTAQAIQAALDGEYDPAAVSYINTATQDGPFGTLGHLGVLIEWSQGPAFLIDTGMPPDRAVAFGAPMERFLDAGPTTTFGAIEEQMRAAIDGIGGIAFTHLHSDHTDGITAICVSQASPATMYQSELQRNLRNYGTRSGAAQVAGAACPRETLNTSVIKPIAGFPGLIAIAAGGHTPGSTIYATRFRDKVRIFAGDITNDMQSLHDNRDKPWAYTTFLVPENLPRQAELRTWLESLDRREDFEVLVAHDIRAWEASDIGPWTRRPPSSGLSPSELSGEKGSPLLPAWPRMPAAPFIDKQEPHP